MKYLLLLVVAISTPVFAQVSSISSDSIEEVQPMTNYYDQMVMPGQPFYPTLMYASLPQDVMLKAAVEMEKLEVAEAYSDVLVVKIDMAIDRIVAKAKTVAKTKEGQAIFLGESVSKIMMVQQQFYGSPNDILHVLNYMGYKLSVEIMRILYGDLGNDVEGLITMIEGK